MSNPAARSPLSFEVSLNRVLRYLNWLVGVALVVVLGAVYWSVYRVLPKTSGEISAPVRAEASIVRDRLGVPHIRAANLEDALFLQGYATAQDRLWQMDALRRLAGGRLSEIIGPTRSNPTRRRASSGCGARPRPPTRRSTPRSGLRCPTMPAASTTSSRHTAGVAGRIHHPPLRSGALERGRFDARSASTCSAT